MNWQDCDQSGRQKEIGDFCFKKSKDIKIIEASKSSKIIRGNLFYYVYP